ncbi:MAG: acyl-CoA dehydrogenase family protein [Pseudomonadota bacterium]|nr:acyl-CoA dehydrogenase family protein [Pseudomonadota bacterium]
MFDFLLTEEEKKLKQEVREFVKNVPSELVRAMDSGEIEFAREFITSAARKNLLGLRFPPDYQGRGLNWVAEMTAMEEVGILGSTLGCHYAMPSIVGEALSIYGTKEQKEKYLKPILNAEIFCAEALTEPRGGSDFFGAATTARKVGGEYILNGQKRFVVGAEGADVFLVYAKTAPENPPQKSISLFIVERDMGVEVKKVYGLMGTRGGGTGRIIFDQLRIPPSCLLGEENAGGEIFNQMMIPERMTSAGGALGAARGALEVATIYTTRRQAFGRTIMKFQGVNFKIADSIAALDAATSLSYAAARLIDSGRDARRLVSEAKKVATEAAWDVVNNAMQVMGGIGYTDVYPVERLLRDIRLMMIWTGTNEIMNLLIQHEYYRELGARQQQTRNLEQDAGGLDEQEKVYE